LLDTCLREAGYEVLTAASGDEALAMLARNEVGAVLADLWMPGTSGIDLLQQVKGLYPDVTRMLLTGSADIASLVDAINKGAIYKIVMKPWDNDALAEGVRDAFGRYVAAKESAGVAQSGS
jgi:DNA-binding NtrC family response regulator